MFSVMVVCSTYNKIVAVVIAVTSVKAVVTSSRTMFAVSFLILLFE